MMRGRAGALPLLSTGEIAVKGTLYSCTQKLDCSSSLAIRLPRNVSQLAGFTFLMHINCKRGFASIS